MRLNTFLRLADRTGCSLSIACGVHCLATPLFVTFLSISPFPEGMELPMVVAALVIAAVTFSMSFVRTGAVAPLGAFLIAAPLMIASRSLEGRIVEVPLLVIAAVLLCAGHVHNLRASYAAQDGACG